MDLVFITGNIAPWMFAGVVAFTFVASLIFVPWAIVRLPADYFHYHARHRILWGALHPVLRLTILIGVLLLDFPGKFTFERWLISRKPILHTSNWLRKKAHKEPLWLD